MESILHFLTRTILESINENIVLPQEFLNEAGFFKLDDAEIRKQLTQGSQALESSIDKERQWWSEKEFLAFQENAVYNFIICQAILKRRYHNLATEQSERE